MKSPGLRDPFYAVDSRDYQPCSSQPRPAQQDGAQILCIEKKDPHVPYERAVMGIRFNDYMIGISFTPKPMPSG